MRGLHWWTLLGGIALGYFVLPPVISAVRGRMS